jgi:Grx4 family monothiol glutaredoxin
MAGTVVEVSSEAEMHAVCGEHSGLCAVLLWAPWHPPSVHLTNVLEAIARQERTVRFAKANADVCASLATLLGADQVPFVAFLDPRGKKIAGLAGADPPRLVEKVKALASHPFDTASSTPTCNSNTQDLNGKLKALINSSEVLLFMKGSKVEPFCKFSKQAIALLNKVQVEYSTFDILKDEEVRAGLKEYSNWKTYPQLYVNGEFIGGVDIMNEMDEDGSLAEALSSAPKHEKSLEERLKDLINREKVMLFMKGDPQTPRCGFSGKIVDILKANKVSFGHFDILSDEDVRQGLKAYSNWPTYPQVYAGGKLIGGVDIVRELDEEGSLVEELGMQQ